MTTISNDIGREKPSTQRGDAAVVRARLGWPLLGDLRGVLRDAIGAWRARRANQPLDVLDDRMLRDIGMVRSESAHRIRRHNIAEW
jgi:uncharacterized protein YjiS (DUF1127 family)